jgi:hypothetical protein
MTSSTNSARDEQAHSHPLRASELIHCEHPKNGHHAHSVTHHEHAGAVRLVLCQPSLCEDCWNRGARSVLPMLASSTVSGGTGLPARSAW